MHAIGLSHPVALMLFTFQPLLQAKSFEDFFKPTRYIYGVAAFVAECLALSP